jgi:hypothetical protein
MTKRKNVDITNTRNDICQGPRPKGDHVNLDLEPPRFVQGGLLSWKLLPSMRAHACAPASKLACQLQAVG